MKSSILIIEKNTVPLKKTFFERDTITVAKELLGRILVIKKNKTLHSFYIVETEAYLGTKDPACHSYRGYPTPRTQVMFGPGGKTYVYFVYGMYYCLNVVTQKKGIPEAVLIRALQPILPSQEVLLKPLTFENSPKKFLPTEIIPLTQGPGKLCRYLGINKSWNDLPVYDPKSPIWIGDWLQSFKQKIQIDETFLPIQESPRIGLESYGEAALWPLRFFIKGNPFVSKTRKNSTHTRLDKK